MTTRRSQRRRRVIYNVHNGGAADLPTPRQTEQLRRARKPIAVYGERVQRRLDARWFSIVPIKRTSMTILVVMLVMVAFVLTTTHSMTELWQWLRLRPELARPLQIGRVDSIASYLIAMTWTATGGMALLVYQIRRYRLDDYRGQYRLWRTIMITSLLLGVNQIIGLIAWLGHWVEAVFGQRIGLSGGHWIRLLITMAAAVLTLRLLVDVRRSRLALIALLTAGFAAALPETVRWHLWTIESSTTWVIVTAAPVWTTMLACIAVTAYLRTVYRDVLEIEDSVSFKIALPSWPRLLTANVQSISNESTDGGPQFKSDNQDEADREQTSKPNQSPEQNLPSKSSWFSRSKRREKDMGSTAGAENVPAKSDAAIQPAATSRVQSAATNPSRSSSDNDGAAESTSASSQPRRFGLSRFLKGRSASADDPSTDEGDDSGSSPSRAKVSKPVHPSAAADQSTTTSQDSASDEAMLNEEDVNWDSLNKSDRRRLRKQLKRQGRAA